MTDEGENKVGEKYIMITPVKNEEDNLPVLINSIANQDLKPIIWVIVDDSSDDSSPSILEVASEKNSYIQVITLSAASNYDIGEHYAEVCSIGFKYAIDYCKEKLIAYEYIALSDADMIYPKDYFSKLIAFLNDNPEYGIVSGRILIRTEEGNIYEEKVTKVGDSFPRGTGRVWRKKTFEETKGYLIAKAPDTVSNILAHHKGWRLGQIDVIFYQTRPTGAGNNLWKGFFKRGESLYYLGANPLIIFNSVVDLIFISRQKRSLLKSFGLICGYFSSLFLRKPQIEIEEVKDYFSYKQTFSHYVMFIRGLLTANR